MKLKYTVLNEKTRSQKSMLCESIDRKFYLNIPALISRRRKVNRASLGGQGGETDWEGAPGNFLKGRKCGLHLGWGESHIHGVCICQNSSNCTLQICAVTVYKLYLNEESVLRRLSLWGYLLSALYDLFNSQKDMRQEITLFVFYRWEYWGREVT